MEPPPIPGTRLRGRGIRPRRISGPAGVTARTGRPEGIGANRIPDSLDSAVPGAGSLEAEAALPFLHG